MEHDPTERLRELRRQALHQLGVTNFTVRDFRFAERLAVIRFETEQLAQDDPQRAVLDHQCIAMERAYRRVAKLSLSPSLIEQLAVRRAQDGV